jgi:hypothetical protein
MKNLSWLMAALLTLSFPLGAIAKNQKLTARSHIDCRHCLDLPTSGQVIRCAERYM